ncbi:MAG: hypothetical protein VB108_08750 [Anaerolineaceae bacterium]|nr:hypothetical protein [Anaerolineaceae bacterium]
MIETIEVKISNEHEETPASRLILDFEIAYAKFDIPGMMKLMSEDCVLEVIGADFINGRANVETYINQTEGLDLFYIHLKNIIVEKNHGVCWGSYKTKEGLRFAFSDIFTFQESSEGLLLSRISSYIIQSST